MPRVRAQPTATGKHTGCKVSGWFLLASGEPSLDEVRFTPLDPSNLAGIVYGSEAVVVEPNETGMVCVTLTPGRYRVESGRRQFVILVPEASDALLTEIMVR